MRLPSPSSTIYIVSKYIEFYIFVSISFLFGLFFICFKCKQSIRCLYCSEKRPSYHWIGVFHRRRWTTTDQIKYFRSENKCIQLERANFFELFFFFDFHQQIHFFFNFRTKRQSNKRRKSAQNRWIFDWFDRFGNFPLNKFHWRWFFFVGFSVDLFPMQITGKWSASLQSSASLYWLVRHLAWNSSKYALKETVTNWAVFFAVFLLWI